MSADQNQEYGVTNSQAYSLPKWVGLPEKIKTFLGKFKFEYSLTKDDMRWWNHVTKQSCGLECSSMPVKGYSVHAELRYYGRNKQIMPVVYGRFQAMATGGNTMLAVYFL